MHKNKNYSKVLKHKIFKIISQASKELNLESYVIGGFVRDHLLQRGQPKDIDIVTVGSGIELAKKVSALLPHKPKVQIFKNYGTAMLKADNLEIEFVGARTESYLSLIHISEPTRRTPISYAVFCLKKKKK